MTTSIGPAAKEIMLKLIEGFPRMGPSGNVYVTFSVLCQARSVLSSTDSTLAIFGKKEVVREGTSLP
jgi:hypothetical protein